MRYSLLALLLTLPALVSSQMTESLDLVDCPTAGLLMSAGYQMDLTVEPEGGSIFTLRIGFLDRFLIGFSYGGSEIIGSGEPDWNPRVEFNARLRVLDEAFYAPAVAVGFNSQGSGRYIDSDGRYRLKSKGFYAVAGKHMEFLGSLGAHGGINYSLERADQSAMDIFLGVEQILADQLSIMLEYDFALDDNLSDGRYGEGGGYLNCGIRWLVQEGFFLDLALKNLNGNRADPRVQRGVRISYIGYL
jgi:hypothetical protein